MKSPKNKPLPRTGIDQQIRRRTFVSFGVFAGLSSLAYVGLRWLNNSPKEVRAITGGAKEPFRRALNKTELAFRRIFDSKNLVKTYPKSDAAKSVRKNGKLGLTDEIDVSAWRLQVEKASGGRLNITLAELNQLPKTEIVFDFKCVEGWNQIQHWGGVKFQDFVQHYKLREEIEMPYAGLTTPNGRYYVGIDMESMLHPQTILAYEMNGEPLIPIHGAPLRLIIPVKYGIKNLKCIGTIKFSNQRTPDYWAEQGYDYYSGL